MPKRRLVLAPPAAAAPRDDLREAFAAIRAEFDVPAAFPPEAAAEAQAVAAAGPAAGGEAAGRRDDTGLDFFTIDPAGSMDLDQAMYLERDGDGHRVRYAIADVPAFVADGGAVDTEARKRGTTLYLPDGRCPLHPAELSEGAASLLPDAVRPAFVWDLRLDGTGVCTSARVDRAEVRSRRRWAYDEAQAALDGSVPPPELVLLREVGLRRIEQERLRGGASLPMPEQEIVPQDGSFRVRFRPPVPLEEWNAQVSLLTGMAAAHLMLDAGVGILRTMPPPEPEAVERFRRQAAALGVPWPEDAPYGEFLRGLDRTRPAHLALVHEATALFRGSGYTPFDASAPQQRVHAAVAAPYAHVTAPLRRLVDRFGLAVCTAVSAGESPPAWAREALPALPDIMRAADQKAGAVDRACTDAVEAAELSGDVGREFPAVVVDDRGAKGLLVQLAAPAVVAPCDGSAPLGADVTVRLVTADVPARRVRFALA